MSDLANSVDTYHVLSEAFGFGAAAASLLRHDASNVTQVGHVPASLAIPGPSFSKHLKSVFVVICWASKQLNCYSFLKNHRKTFKIWYIELELVLLKKNIKPLDILLRSKFGWINKCAEGNKHGRGVIDTACIPHNHTLTVLFYRYNIFMPVYLHCCWVFLWPCESQKWPYYVNIMPWLKIFCRNLVKTLSIMFHYICVF